VAASIPIVGRLSVWRPPMIAAAVGSAAAAAVIVGVLAPMEAPSGWWFMAASGMIGITALLLPGISGAFLLVLLGQYDTVIGAIADLDLIALLPFALGAAVGLFTFARAITALLRAYPDATHAALAGFLVGSLPRVWPWQGEGERLALSTPPDALAAILAVAGAAVGAGLVWGLHAAARRR
jgi:putative membrane protein